MIGVPAPRSDDSKQKTTTVSVTLGADDKARIARAARESGVSMAAYCRTAILKTLGGA
jgi:hypothetical protein